MKHRLPGLDGLRAVSIALVLVYHVSRTTGFPRAWVQTRAAVGVFGVEIFFVISGFLITGLLLGQEARDGRIKLWRFYVRRAFRILPAAYTYLFVLVGVGFVGLAAVRPEDVFAPAFFVRNLTGRSDLTAHYWSLSIEEQFYLTWPLVLLLVRPSWRIRATTILCCVAPLWRQLNVIAYGAPQVNWVRADLRYDPLLVGALLALVQDNQVLKARLDRVLGRPHLWFTGALTLLGISVFADIPFPGVVLIPLKSINFLAVALVIKILAEGWCTPAQRFFNAGPVMYVGRISYSLYLWQQLFCFPKTDAWFQRFPTNVVLALLVASASYYGVEQPALRLRDQLEHRVAPAAPKRVA